MAKLVTFVNRTLRLAKHNKLTQPAMRVGLVKKRNDHWGAVRVELIEMYRNEYLNMVCSAKLALPL